MKKLFTLLFAVVTVAAASQPSQSGGGNQTFTVNGVSFTMVAVQGGTFTMGATSEQGSDAKDNEKPAHKVTVSSFLIGQTEVTQELWQAVMSSNPSHFNGKSKEYDLNLDVEYEVDYGINLKRPVESVSWDDCQAFLRKLNQLTGKNFRLPTEAEWEYAARAGKNENIYPWDGALPLTEDEGCFYANFKPNEGNYVRDGSIITSPVGTYEPNDNGLFDMAGNVSEWTSTSYTESIDLMTNDLNPEYRYNVAREDPYKMSRKIVRGGSWKDVAHNIRSDIRMWEYQNEQRSYIGFRCVRTKVGFTKSKRKNNCCD